MEMKRSSTDLDSSCFSSGKYLIRCSFLCLNIISLRLRWVAFKMWLCPMPSTSLESPPLADVMTGGKLEIAVC